MTPEERIEALERENEALKVQHKADDIEIMGLRNAVTNLVNLIIQNSKAS